MFELMNPTLKDLDALCEMERLCFPPDEMLTREQLAPKLDRATGLWLLARDLVTGQLAGFLDGVASDAGRFDDLFFDGVAGHDPLGQNIMLTGLEILPAYRGRGLAHRLMAAYQALRRAEGRRALFLTCHAEKLAFYRGMGFESLGSSASALGSGGWLDCVCRL